MGWRSRSAVSETARILISMLAGSAIVKLSDTRVVRLAALVLVAAAFSASCALSTRRIGEIQHYPGRYEDRSIWIEGIVTSSWRVPFVPMAFYKVADGTGEITVVADDPRVPPSGARVRVRGRVDDVATFGRRTVGLHLRQERLQVARWEP